MADPATTRKWTREHSWGLAIVLTAVALVAILWWGIDVTDKLGEPTFFVAFVGLVANVVMAGAAIWAVLAAQEWRDEMRGKSLHELAMHAMTLARKMESACHRALDRWAELASNPRTQLGALRENLVELVEIRPELSEMIARLDGIAGEGMSAPIRGLRDRMEDILAGMNLHQEQRMHPNRRAAYEPTAGLKRISSGFYDPARGKAIVTSYVTALAAWADPQLGASSSRPINVAELKKRLATIEAERADLMRGTWDEREKLAEAALPPVAPEPSREI